jgi:hypothetical protein
LQQKVALATGHRLVVVAGLRSIQTVSFENSEYKVSPILDEFSDLGGGDVGVICSEFDDPEISFGLAFGNTGICH